MVKKKDSSKTLNFITSGTGSCAWAWPCSENAIFFLFLSTLGHGSDKVYSNDDQGRVYQNCKFHDPRCRGSCAGAWPYSENIIFLVYTGGWIR